MDFFLFQKYFIFNKSSIKYFWSKKWNFNKKFTILQFHNYNFTGFANMGIEKISTDIFVQRFSEIWHT